MLANAIVFVLAFLAGVLVLYAWERKKKKSVYDSLRNGIIELSRGNLEFRFPAAKSHSLAALQSELRVMAERLLKNESTARSDQAAAAEKDAAVEDWQQKILIQAEVQRSLSEIVSGFAHEINNPLTGVFGYIDLLLIRESVPQEVKDKLTQIKQQAMRIKGIIEKLNQLDPESTHTKYEIDLVNLLDKMIKVFGNQHAHSDINFERKFAMDSLVVYGNHFSLWQAFDNIISNSIEAIEENRIRNGRITVELGKSPDGQYAVVDVIDNGGGFSNIGKAFDPFFTTKNRSQNKGIGLTIVFNIIKEHLGSILVSNNERSGATVSVFLPLMGAFRHESMTIGG